MVLIAAAACSSAADGEIRGRARSADGQSTVTAGAEFPAAGIDHVHQAVGIKVCDEWLPDIADPGIDPEGIHTHGEGIIHVHPFVDAAAGPNATLEVFAELVNVGLRDGELIVNGAALVPSGTECDGRPGEWGIFVWTSDDISTGSPPRRVENESDVPLDFDRGAIAWAYLADEDELDVPPSFDVFAEWDASRPD